MRPRIVWILTGALLLLATGVRGEQPALLQVVGDQPESVVAADGWLPDELDALPCVMALEVAESLPDEMRPRTVVLLPQSRYSLQPPVRGPPALATA